MNQPEKEDVQNAALPAEESVPQNDQVEPVPQNDQVESVPQNDQADPVGHSMADYDKLTENYIEAYHATAEWIRFADAKAGVVLAVSGAIAGLLIPTIHRVFDPENKQVAHLISNWEIIVVTAFCFFLFFLLASGLFAFLCINPLRKRGKHPSLDYCDHFHPAAISAKYQLDQCAEFSAGCFQNGSEGMLKEVQAALLFDAHISTIKYTKVRMSLKLFGASIAFGFVYYLLLQL